MMLYMPIAPPGAGKSYTAELMVKAKIIDADAVVCPDRYREILTGDRTDQTANQAVFRIVDIVTEQRVRYNQDIYLDGTNLNKKFRDKILQSLNSTFRYYHNLKGQLPLTILVTDEPRWVIEERNKGRRYPVPDHVFERFWGIWEALDLDPLVSDWGAEVLTFREMEDLAYG